MASAVTEEDNRKVQTAVLGGSQGHRPVFLPFEKDDADSLRRLHGADAFSCGVLLGGCGQVLTLRACGDRKSHFAHRPPVRCRRTAVGENSADHLYIGEALVRWLRGRGQGKVTVAYVRQAHARSDSIEIRFGPKGRRLLHVQMARRSFSEWKDDGRRLEAAPGKSPTIRTYGPESELSPYEVQAAGHALRFRCEPRDGTREVSIGTQSPDHKVQWTILERCRLSDLGIVTPSLEATPGSDVLRLKRAEGSGTWESQPQRPATERGEEGGREEQPLAAVVPSRETAESAFDEPVDPRVKAARSGLPPLVDDLLVRFTAAGFGLVLAGATVRQALEGRVGRELDFVTDSDTQQVRQIIRGWGDELRVHRADPPDVVSLRKVVGADSYTVRISSCPAPPRDRASRSPRAAEHEKALVAYLRRSDFTIDAMALGLSHVTLKDPFGGLQDLERRVLRTPRAPMASVANDPPLMLRVVRCAARLGFEPVSELRDAMRTMARRVSEIPTEDVREEFTATMLAARPGAGLRLLVDTRIAEHVLPELPALRFESAEHHRHKDIYEHTLKVLDQAIALETEGPDLTLRWAALLHDIGTPRTRRTGQDGHVSFHHHEVVGSKMARRRLLVMAYPEQLVQDVSRLVELHLRFHGYAEERWTDPAVRRYVRDAGPVLERLHKLTRADCTTQNKRKAHALARAYDSLEERIERLAVEDERQAARPDLDGYQIMEILDIRPGAELGRAYEYMRDLRMEKGPMDFETARDALLAWRDRRVR